MVTAELYSGSCTLSTDPATLITRSYHTNKLFLPKANKRCFKCSIQYAGANVPDSLRNNCSLNVFKDTLKLFRINSD